MRVVLFQQNCIWLDVEANYARIEAELRRHSGADLLVLPEMCTTGFVLQPDKQQLQKAVEVERRLLQLSLQYQMAVCGSFAVCEDRGEVDSCQDVVNYNRCYFVTPEGHIYKYDKRHLFAPGGEHLAYASGQERTIVLYKGIRFLLQVCYDMRFPVWSRYSAENAYDVLLCCANWPEQRMVAWEMLLRARAIENQAYVLGVNRVGADMLCPYRGGTMAVHPYGDVISSVADYQEGTCEVEIDMEGLSAYRMKFPTLTGADAFTLI